MIPHNSDIASRKEYGTIQLQRLFRGVHTRMIIRNQRYIKLNESVTKLQRAYRKWRMFQFYKMKQSHILQDDAVTGNWKEVITGHGTFAERMVVWRAIIELRRAYPEFDAELCIRALTLGEGDIQRAHVIISYPDFYMRYQSAPQIPKYQRECFLPCYVPGSTYLAPPTDPHHEAQPAGLMFTGSGPGRNEKPIKINAQGNIRQQSLDVGIVAPGSVNFSDALKNSYFLKTVVGVRQKATASRPKSATATSTMRKSTTNLENTTNNSGITKKKKKTKKSGAGILEEGHVKALKENY